MSGVVMGQRVMVTGSRDYTDEETVNQHLTRLVPTVVLHGDAPGADTIAKRWAIDHGIPALGIPAAWDFYGRKVAGPKRNGWLLDENPDIVIAFPLPQSRGTWNAVDQARERGIPVIVV